MSTQINGYGICTNDIKNTTIEKIKALIAMAPNVQAYCLPDYEDAEEDGVSTPEEFADYLGQGWDGHDEGGLATLLAVVIGECEGLKLLDTVDSICDAFLILPEKLPWEYTDQEKALTKEDLNAIFRKYISVLTDEEIAIGYKYIEND